MKPNIVQIFVVVLICAYLIYALVNEQWETIVDSMAFVGGMCVGDLLMRGAYRLFSWGESTSRFIAWGVGIGGAIIWSILVFVPIELRWLGDIASSGILGFTLLAVIRVIAIRDKQLRTEDRR
jgi:hypothetical protein